MEETDQAKSPIIRRLGSTRKLLVFNNIRLQLNEQLRCLDSRMDAQLALLTELQDFFRRRGELEMDYSRNLDKLAKSLQLRHKEQKPKREQWPLFSTYTYWQQLITQTKTLSKDHMNLSEVYSTHLVARLTLVMEDVQRIYKRCREVGYETHEEILRVLHELHTTMKTYHGYRTELRQSEAKLRTAEMQRNKLGSTLSQNKLERSRKFKLMEKEVIKRKNKYANVKLKALKARNEYILCLEASNTTIHKYFVDDLSDLIDCMDFGFQNCVSRAFQMHVTAEDERQKSLQNSLDALSSCIRSLDSRLDKQRFLEHNRSAFMVPKKFEFQEREEVEGKIDEPLEPELRNVLRCEMQSRLTQLQLTVATLKAESEEVWKTLETTESTLLDMLLQSKDNDCRAYFGDENALQKKIVHKPFPEVVKARQETEDFYLSKFREYLMGSSKIARLDAKQEYLRQSLTEDTPEICQNIKPIVKPASRRKRIGGRLHLHPDSGQPKLFGGSLEEYQEATNQKIPLILRSCIRVINLYGLHHQGIFRVSGSQVEINNFREWFERGDDPLADVTDASDINSVAGVLKLYLRELREPLFPIVYFEQLMEFAQLQNKREFIHKMREIIKALPRSVMIVLRYLFAFLNHLSEFSDENMMDPYNLAICFGPTLVPVPEDKEDQVQYQNQVNELIKNIIIYHEDIFPSNDEESSGAGGADPVYEKYISSVTCDDDDNDRDVTDSPSPSSDQTQQDDEIEESEVICPSDDDLENATVEATAQYDFAARSNRELSFRKGDTVTLYAQVSNDWWRGAINGEQGLIPDKYVSLKMKNDTNDGNKINCNSSTTDLSTSLNDMTLSQSLCEATNYVVATSSNSTPDGGGGGGGVMDTTSVTILPSHSIGSDITSICAERNAPQQMTEAKAINCQNYPVNNVEKNYDHTSNKESDSVSCRQLVGSAINELSLAGANFMENRDLWERRATSRSTTVFSASSPASPLPLIRNQRLSEPTLYHTPDLVIDLPGTNCLSLNNVEQQCDQGGQVTRNNFDSPEETAAETFAKQNQSTLKKNSKILIDHDKEQIKDFLMAITSPRKEYSTVASSTAAAAVVTATSTSSTFKPPRSAYANKK